MGYLIDAEALLGTRKPAPLGPSPSGMVDGDDEIFLSIVTADELLRSVAMADGGGRARRMAWVEAVLADVPILPLDEKTVRIHAGLAAERGGLAGPDRWLLATCLAHGLSLWTGRPGVFKSVSAIPVISGDRPARGGRSTR